MALRSFASCLCLRVQTMRGWPDEHVAKPDWCRRVRRDVVRPRTLRAGDSSAEVPRDRRIMRTGAPTCNEKINTVITRPGVGMRRKGFPRQIHPFGSLVAGRARMSAESVSPRMALNDVEVLTSSSALCGFQCRHQATHRAHRTGSPKHGLALPTMAATTLRQR